MSLLDAFGQDATCPLCGSMGAKKLLFFVKCPNRSCGNFQGGLAMAPSRPSRPAAAEAPREFPINPDFNPGAAAVTLRYKNHLGQERVFTGDGGSLREKGAHVSLKVAPTGLRITLAKKRILNLMDVQGLIQKQAARNPGTPVEAQIMGYHEKHGTTSPRYEELKKKYPDRA